MTPDLHSSFDALLREAAALRAPASRSVALPEPGEVLQGKYRIDEKLAQGGMGAVFRATNIETGKQVAIKWLLGKTPQAGLRFSREARVAARIDHPNVVNVFDSGSHEGGRYLVMELLRGESLGERIRRGRVPSAELIEIMIPVLRGLAAAHRAGVIHRDLKPDNVFLCLGSDDAERQPKVLDFGISKLRSAPALDERLTGQGTGLGTLAYMSPEQLVDAPNVDERTDIYAAGAMMYEALTGCLPFRAEGHNALVLAIAAQRPLPITALVADVPRALERVVMRAMAKEPNERQPDAQALIEELQALRAGASANATGGEARGPSGWTWAAAVALPLAISIWLAGHPAERKAQPPSESATLRPALQKQHGHEQQPASEAQNAPAEPPRASPVAVQDGPVPVHTSQGRAPRALLRAKQAGVSPARPAREAPRSRAGTIRWSDL